MSASKISGLAALLGLASTPLSLSSPLQSPHGQHEASRCSESFFRSAIPHGASVLSVTTEHDNAMLASVSRGTNLAGYCNVVVSTSAPGSCNRFKLSLTLPPAAIEGGWNSRFLAMGNGGYDGGLEAPLRSVPQAAVQGFAVVVTDTGHDFEEDLDEKLTFGDDVDALRDWGFRAMDGSVGLGKELVRRYYGVGEGDALRSYYSGCSTGGRQGLRQLMVDPDSFDGLLIGAPAWDQVGLLPWVAKIADFNHRSGRPLLDRSELFVSLFGFVTVQCDGLDGARDAIVQFPENCNRLWREQLSARYRCREDPADGCLTDEQIDVVNFLLEDHVVGDVDLYRGYDITAAALFGVYVQGDDDKTRDFERHFLGSPETASRPWPDVEEEVVRREMAEDPGRTTVDLDDANLRSFRGKMMLYQGLADGLIPARSTEQLFEALRDNLDVVYFEVPGLGHCFNGRGDNDSGTGAPWYFGAAAQSAVWVDDLEGDVYINGSRWASPENNALEALVDWVENGRPSGEVTLLASRLDANSSDVNDPDPLRQRRLCQYPEMSIYQGNVTDGEEGTNNLDNWECRVVDRSDGEVVVAA